MRDGIQRHAAHAHGSRVAALRRRPAVGGLVKRDRKNERDSVDADKLNRVIEAVHGVA